MNDGSKKKAIALGMPFGTATHRLRKAIMFMLAQKCEMTVCFRCRCEIKTVEEFSIEHKKPWQKSSDPVGLFFALDNISFSHVSCNIGAGAKPHKKWNSEKERWRHHSKMQNANPITREMKNETRRVLRRRRAKEGSVAQPDRAVVS